MAPPVSSVELGDASLSRDRSPAGHLRRRPALVVTGTGSLEQPKHEGSLPPTPDGVSPVVEVDDDYDPRRPEFIRPATAAEELEGSIRIVQAQIKRLAAAVSARQGRDFFPGVVAHYQSVITELRSLESKQSKAIGLLRAAPPQGLQAGTIRPQRTSSMNVKQPGSGGSGRRSPSIQTKPIADAPSPSRIVRRATKECQWLAVPPSPQPSPSQRGRSTPHMFRRPTPAHSPKGVGVSGDPPSPMSSSIKTRAAPMLPLGAWQVQQPPTPPPLRSSATYARFQALTAKSAASRTVRS